MIVRILSLNAWGATLQEELKDFIEHYRSEIDIFCFQEASEDVQGICREVLVDYQPIMLEDPEALEHFKQATYVKNHIAVANAGSVLQGADKTGLGLWVEVELGNVTFLVLNFHGASRPVDKLDNPDRLEASRTLIDCAAARAAKPVIIGDFNLEKDTQSVAMFEQSGYRNLIHEYDIKTTRNHYAWDRFPDSKQYYADFAFVRPEIKVVDFSVMTEEVSDHQPLLLEIEVQYGSD